MVKKSRIQQVLIILAKECCCKYFKLFSFLQIGAVPLAALGAPTLDPALAALGLPGANLNSQVCCFGLLKNCIVQIFIVYIFGVCCLLIQNLTESLLVLTVKMHEKLEMNLESCI